MSLHVLCAALVANVALSLDSVTSVSGYNLHEISYVLPPPDYVLSVVYPVLWVILIGEYSPFSLLAPSRATMELLVDRPCLMIVGLVGLCGAFYFSCAIFATWYGWILPGPGDVGFDVVGNIALLFETGA